MVKYIITKEGEENDLLPVHLFVEDTLRRRKHKREVTPTRSQKVWNHSPDGFNFGYGGSGPAQLALAILLEHINDKDRAVALHQDFKWEFISRLVHPGGEITGKSIDLWLQTKENERNKTN